MLEVVKLRKWCIRGIYSYMTYVVFKMKILAFWFNLLGKRCNNLRKPIKINKSITFMK